MFAHDSDYLAFEAVLAEVQQRIPMRILAWCVMPNHWHLLLWPRQDGDLSSYMRLVPLTHTQRRHACCASAGTGHLYQGRFKSFVVQSDAHFLTVSRYVEANALRGNLVRRAEDWRWGSLWRQVHGKGEQPPQIHSWPVMRPSDWLMYVNQPLDAVEVDALRRCAQRGRPYGVQSWTEAVAQQLGLECTLRPRGRPPKEAKGEPDLFSKKGS